MIWNEMTREITCKGETPEKDSGKSVVVRACHDNGRNIEKTIEI